MEQNQEIPLQEESGNAINQFGNPTAQHKKSRKKNLDFRYYCRSFYHFMFNSLRFYWGIQSILCK